jgi:two-component system sensor histidine kinase/response regulator
MKKILVIEDTADIRALISEMLQSRGFEVLGAEDGTFGVQIAEAQSPDLILCDVQMPRMNGFEVLQRLRENESTSTIPFIFLTGAADKMQVRHGMELGADDYLTKPFTLQELLAAVAARLETRATLAKAAARKLADLRDSITFSLPHEFITPLNGILGFSSILVEQAGKLTGNEIEEFGRIFRSRRCGSNGQPRISCSIRSLNWRLARADKCYLRASSFPSTKELHRSPVRRRKKPIGRVTCI